MPRLPLRLFRLYEGAGMRLSAGWCAYLSAWCAIASSFFAGLTDGVVHNIAVGMVFLSGFIFGVSIHDWAGER